MLFFYTHASIYVCVASEVLDDLKAKREEEKKVKESSEVAEKRRLVAKSSDGSFDPFSMLDDGDLPQSLKPESDDAAAVAATASSAKMKDDVSDEVGHKLDKAHEVEEGPDVTFDPEKDLLDFD